MAKSSGSAGRDGRERSIYSIAISRGATPAQARSAQSRFNTVTRRMTTYQRPANAPTIADVHKEDLR